MHEVKFDKQNVSRKVNVWKTQFYHFGSQFHTFSSVWISKAFSFVTGASVWFGMQSLPLSAGTAWFVQHKIKFPYSDQVFK